MQQQQPTNKKLSCILYVIFLSAVPLLLFYSIDYILYKVFSISYYSLSGDILSIITQASVYIIVISVGLKKERKTLKSVCSFKKISGKVWVAAILCSVGFTLFYIYIISLAYSFRYGWDTDIVGSSDNFLVSLIDTAIIPAIAEEIMDKGLIFSILKKNFSTITSVIITSILFSAGHRDLIRFIPLFLFSCYFFWVYLRTGSIILPIMLHFVNNLFSFVLISEPFSSLGTFYSGLGLFLAGSYMLYNVSKTEKKA